MADNTQNMAHRDETERVVAQYVSLKGGLMSALHGLQHAFGHVPSGSYDVLAKTFNLSPAEVYGVKSFYHDFTDAPLGRHVIEICQAESCQARGSRALTRHVQDLLGIQLGETTIDGHYSLTAVYCLGNCAVSPNITLDGRLHGRITADGLDSLLKKAGV